MRVLEMWRHSFGQASFLDQVNFFFCTSVLLHTFLGEPISLLHTLHTQAICQSHALIPDREDLSLAFNDLALCLLWAEKTSVSPHSAKYT